MVISLVGHERNLGILTLTDHLLERLGKINCVVVGWNYLIENHPDVVVPDEADCFYDNNKVPNFLRFISFYKGT